MDESRFMKIFVILYHELFARRRRSGMASSSPLRAQHFWYTVLTIARPCPTCNPARSIITQGRKSALGKLFTTLPQVTLIQEGCPTD